MSFFENKNDDFQLKELGEFGLIQHLTNSITLKHNTSIKGVGDDAAVIAKNNKELVVVTTDMLTEGIHFDLMYTPLKHLGYKAVTVNLSDIYAMNATPQQITVSFAISQKLQLKQIEELYAGMLLACKKYNVDIVGGDTCASLTGLTISITAIGTVSKNKIVYRSGAKQHDLICVSGDLGAAYIGLQLLEREKQIFQENPSVQPDLEGKDYILERQLKPEARKDIVQFLETKNILPTSMIDISDGLASELHHLAKASDLGCHVYAARIPIDYQTEQTASEFNIEPITAAIYGGEDYELLFTINPNDYEKIKSERSIAVIGHMTSQKDVLLIDTLGNATKLEANGWNAFRQT